MGKSKTFIVSLAIVISIVLFFIAWVYTGFYGTPWRIIQTKSTAEKYLSEKYPDLKYEINNTYYNFKFQYYACSVTAKGDIEVNFKVVVKGKKSIKDDYLEMKVNTEAKTMVEGLIENNVPKITMIIAMEDAGSKATEKSYDKYSSFIPGDAYPLKIDIRWAGDEMLLDDFVDKALSVRDTLKNNNISVCGLDIYDETNGYTIDLVGREKNGESYYNLSKDEIIKREIAYKMK